MARVEGVTTINAHIDKVYELARDIEKFPDYIPTFKSADITERDGNRVVTKLVAEVKGMGLKIKWTEEELWDPDTKTCNFRQIEGDYKSMQGSWTFTDLGNGTTQFNSQMELEYAMPITNAAIEALITQKAKESVDITLESIKRVCEAA
jgi:coenzyme Q-binding protein COQ10